MNDTPMLHRFALGLSVLGWTALVVQGWISINRHIALGPKASTNWRWWRQPEMVTAAAVSILLVGVIYHLLLRKIHHPVGLEYACNLALHYLAPPLFVGLWWQAVPRGSLQWRDAWVAFAFPAAYAVYVFARGEMAGVYPYPFFDVNKLGYPATLVNAAWLSLVFVIVGLVMVAPKRSTPRRDAA